MAEAQRTVLLSGMPLVYTLERKNVKNLNLRIYPDGSVRVSANRRVPIREIEAFLIGHEDFIRKAQSRFRERPQAAPLQYVTGERLPFLGEALELQVVSGEREAAALENGKAGAEAEKSGGFFPAGNAGAPVLGYPVSGGVSGDSPGMLSPVSGLKDSLPHPSDPVDEVPVGLLSAGQGDHHPEQAAAGRAPGMHPICGGARILPFSASEPRQGILCFTCRPDAGLEGAENTAQRRWTLDIPTNAIV